MSLTLTKARKILGKLADNVSDEELEKEIQVAELFKTIFINNPDLDKRKYGKA